MKRFAKAAGLSGLVAFAAQPASNVGAQNGPSFDCRKAVTVVERLICADSRLSELDRVMAESYSKALANQNDKSPLLKQQREFLLARTNCGLESPDEVRPCVSQLTSTRALYLSTLQTKQINQPSEPRNTEGRQTVGPDYDEQVTTTFAQLRVCIRSNMSLAYQAGVYGNDQALSFFRTRCFPSFAENARRVKAGEIADSMFQLVVLQELGVKMPKLDSK